MVRSIAANHGLGPWLALPPDPEVSSNQLHQSSSSERVSAT